MCCLFHFYHIKHRSRRKYLSVGLFKFSYLSHVKIKINLSDFFSIISQFTLLFQVQHVVEDGKVLFFIYSEEVISKGAEITIPFDFDYQER